MSFILLFYEEAGAHGNISLERDRRDMIMAYEAVII